MAAPPPSPDLTHALTLLCDDALFAITGSRRLDLDNFRAFSARRAPAVALAARGTPPVGLDTWDPWVLTRCTAIAPIAPPWWLPMAETIESGLSLEHGARGLRSLFTSRPSDKDVERVRMVGALAVRAIGAVLSATGTLNAEGRLRRDAVLVSLGLPDEIREGLQNEPLPVAEQLSIHGNFDGKLARAITRGCFLAAMNDGVDPRQEQAVLAIARKLGLTTDEVNEARQQARDVIDSAKGFGEASVDGIRYVLEGDAEGSAELAIAAARLTLPTVLRRDAITAINIGSPVVLGRKHHVDRRLREAVLALAWVVCARRNPNYLRRAQLAARHDLLATDLGDVTDGTAIRGALDRHFELELATAWQVATS